jgi:hypothetical protein
MYFASQYVMPPVSLSQGVTSANSLKISDPPWSGTTVTACSAPCDTYIRRPPATMRVASPVCVTSSGRSGRRTAISYSPLRMLGNRATPRLSAVATCQYSSS